VLGYRVAAVCAIARAFSVSPAACETYDLRRSVLTRPGEKRSASLTNALAAAMSPRVRASNPERVARKAETREESDVICSSSDLAEEASPELHRPMVANSRPYDNRLKSLDSGAIALVIDSPALWRERMPAIAV
jgi:hypothetical protein